jgi:hypothetical protein
MIMDKALRNALNLTNKDIDYTYVDSILKTMRNTEELANDIMDSLSDNQIKSKISLIDSLEELSILDKSMRVAIFGSWYGSILIPLLHNKVKHIDCYDKDDVCLNVAKNRLFPNITNIDYLNSDVFTKSYSRYATTNLIINTSCEHMKPMREWPYWHKIQPNSYFAFQSNNMVGIEGHINCVHSLEEFKEQLPANAKIVYEEEIEDTRGIRYMIIGELV